MRKPPAISEIAFWSQVRANLFLRYSGALGVYGDSSPFQQHVVQEAMQIAWDRDWYAAYCAFERAFQAEYGAESAYYPEQVFYVLDHRFLRSPEVAARPDDPFRLSQPLLSGSYYTRTAYVDERGVEHLIAGDGITRRRNETDAAFRQRVQETITKK